MQSVGVERPDLAAEDAPANPGWAHRIVLPRFLRKPVRMLLKMQPPRYFGLKGMGVLFGLTAFAGVVIGGHSTTVVAAPRV